MPFATGLLLGWVAGTLWAMSVYWVAQDHNTRGPTGRGPRSQPFGFAAYLKRGK